MVSKFFEDLPILKDRDGKQVGVCAMGPVGDGDTLLWIEVWIWQQHGDDLAASAGTSGDEVPGAHPLAPDDRPPFAHPKKRWMVETKLEPVSAYFSDEKPAFVQAMALVENGGERRIVQWGQAVMLFTPGGGHDHDDHDH
jgi:hypothetical protein